jgi:quercetin dioxygenase-like cupin family protein
MIRSFASVMVSRHGELLRMEIWTGPNGGVLAEHVHPGLQERYEVLEGEVTFRVDRKLRRAGPGERLVVPAGVPHSFENTGRGIAHLIVEADPALELRELIEDGVRLARTEKAHRQREAAQPPRPDPGGCTGLPLQGHGDPQLTAAGHAASALTGARPLRTSARAPTVEDAGDGEH